MALETEIAKTDNLDARQIAEILEIAIGPLIDDLYREVYKDDATTTTEYLFDKIYETIDRPKPEVFKDAA